MTFGPASPPPPAPPLAGGHTTAEPQGGGCPEELGQDAPETIDGAPRIEAGTLAGCSGLRDRADMFALTAPANNAPVLYTLELSVDPDMEGCLDFYDASRAEARWTGRCGSRGATHKAWVSVMGGTAWYLRIKDLSGNADGTARPWTVKIHAAPLADANEPDETPEQAKALALGQPQTFFFASALNSPGAENDVFKIDVPKDGNVSISVENGDPQVRFTGRVLAAGGAEVIQRKAAANEGANLGIGQKVKKGTYFIKIDNLAGRGTPSAGGGDPPKYLTTPYTITAKLD